MIESKKLLKMVVMYLVYFLYSYYVGMFINSTPIAIQTMIRFVMDLAFLLVMVFIYKDKLKTDIERLKKDKKKVIKKIILGVISVFALNMIMGILTEAFVPNASVDENTLSIDKLANTSFLYMIFKTMIFGTVAEELLFRETLNDCVENNLIFIVLSAIIYTVMNLIFTSNSSDNIILAILVYFLPALLFSYIYIKNERNIILIMAIKICYNMIPLIMLLSRL